MFDKYGEKSAVSTADGSLVSRRRLLAAGAVLGIAGGVGGLVGAQEEAADIELEGEMGGWIGVAPDGIDGETNPTLDLETGEEYTVVWTNADEMPHNFVIEDQEESTLVETEVINEGSQTVTFTATEEMAEYYCGVHPETMRGELAVTTGEDGTDTQDEAETDDPDESVANDTDGDEGTGMDDYGTDDEEGETDDDGEAEETETDDETDGSETDTDGDADQAVELPREYRANLSGDAHGIETDMTGTATFEVHEHGDGPEAHYTLTVEDSCNVTQAHIHLGAADEDGPVVAWLYPETGMEPDPIDGGFSGTLAEGTITADDLVGEWEGAAFTDALATFEDGAAYVNVHTEAHPGGEVRGQIQPVDE